MTKTFQAALSPLLITGSFCGLCFFEYPLGRTRPYISYLYFLITWSIFVYLFCYIVSYTNSAALVNTWVNLVMYNTTIVSMFVSLFRFKGLKMCLFKLSIVDDTLEKLGTPKEYQRLYNWMILVVIGWIVMACLLNIMEILCFGYKDFNIARCILPFLVNHLFHVDTVNDLTWGTILGYIGSRFQRINERIHKLLNDSEHVEREDALIVVKRRRTDAEDYYQLIWIIMHVHLQLCRTSFELNKVFSIQMTLRMASYFMFIVNLLYYLYMSYQDNYKDTFQQVMDSLLFYTWGGIYVVKLITLNHICQAVCDKANETITILYKLSNNRSDHDLRQQTVQFIMQIKQRDVKFSGMGLFYFGYGFVRRFFMSISTVLVIMIQMHTTNDKAVRPSNHTNYINRTDT